MVALLEPFVDTLIVCSMTGLVIVVTGAWNDPAEYVRPALRRDTLPQSTRFNVGFRCAADLPE